MKEKEEQLIVCMYPNSPNVLPGGILGNNCKECNKPVIVNQSSLDALKERGVEEYRYMCHLCFLELLKKDSGDIKIMQPTEKQLGEIRQQINKDNPNIN